ncbi:putative replication protein B [Rhizobium wenxiniae]|uniref:ParB family chromosome partitioning protein n=1 Tax=Rhizobium wenxiniae TaxID=1737357 RepID=A0A7X0D0V3_9HYPH|nr:plasmid partitioning protein RepB [Rhizobium wenxiniae]MBB6163797.1 ParB family chromosome partitioning protein [Rhizobium wenxiniae]GGG18429.1 putative replication protein B [Rhizobium wenxiniae]
MARKNPFANVMNEDRPDNGVALDYTVKGASRTIMSTIDELAERADKMLEGETVVELSPKTIEESFIRDRLEEDPQAFEDLVAAIREHGQTSPILVRPHPHHDSRYMVVFGHRRLKAATVLGRNVRAVVKPISDREHVIAQGQENSARADLSFIEKATFARRLSELHYDNDSTIVMTALSVDKATLSKMMSVANMPRDILDAIGGAKLPGRDRWYELKLLLERPANLAKLREVLAATDLDGLNGDARFAFIVDALTRKKTSGYARPPQKSKWVPKDKGVARAVSAEIRNDGKNYTLALKAKDAVGFGEFIADSLDDLYAEYRRLMKE